MRKLALVISGLVFGAVSASAADMAAHPYAPVPMVAPIFDWSGFYYGVNAGYGSSRNCWDQITTAGTFVAAEGCSNATGAVAGVQFGYRTQISAWVFGFEAQGDWADLNASHVSNSVFSIAPGDITNRSKIDAYGLITGQVGYGFSNVLLYLKGGAALTTARYKDALTGSGTVAATATETRPGAAVGVGLEYGIMPNLSVGIVYDHLFMGNRNVGLTNTGLVTGFTPAGAVVANDRISQGVDLVTVHVNYTFGGPSLAKY